MPSTAGAPGRRRSTARTAVRISASLEKALLDEVDAAADGLGASRALVIARAVECGLEDAQAVIRREGEG